MASHQPIDAWTSLRELLGDHDQDGAWLLAEVEALTRALPDRQRVVRSLLRFLEAGARIATDLRTLRSDPVALALLVELGEHSRLGIELATHVPRMFWDLVQDREYRQIWGRRLLDETLRGQLARLDLAEHRINVLIRFRNYHLLRVMSGDIRGTLGFEAITAELSDLTDVLVQHALHLAGDQLATRYGRPGCGMVVLGMGKLGGRELNYSSDIDLIFVYGGTGTTTGGAREIDHHDYFRRLGAELIRILDAHHPSGRLFRVDMRLRPEGAAGELALSYRETVDYYYGVGRAWERQAMIKARPIAGDLTLGLRLLEELRSWVYPRDHDAAQLEGSRAMRRRIEERAHQDDVKIGAGGIRDIEFLVQHYQLIYGGRLPELRQRATLPALRELGAAGLLEAEEVLALSADYEWLRLVEHRMQMFEGRQLHEVPSDPEHRCELAVRCGFTGPDACAAFDRTLEAVRARVRRIAEEHYLGADDREDRWYALLASAEVDEATAEAVLAPYGFAEPVAALRRIRHMAEEPFFILQRGRTEQRLVQLLPLILPALAEAPDTDEALVNFERIVDAVGGRATFYDLLCDRDDVRRVVCRLAGWATYVVIEFGKHPGVADDFAERLQGETLDTDRDLVTEARDLVVGLADPVPSLGFLQVRELTAAAVADLAGADEWTVWRHLSALARAVLEVLLEHVVAEVAADWGHPRHDDGTPARFAVLGCGKLGGHELSYASDMDVIFVSDPGGQCGDGEHSAEQFWLRVARTFSRRCQGGGLYPVDARLRPWGEQSDLVTTTATLERYWSQERELWERMAMVRVAPVAGDPGLGAVAAAAIRRAALTAPLPADARDQVRHMRARLEESRRGQDHLKRGWGGYTDIEFIAFHGVLGCEPERIPDGSSTADLLAVLAELGRIPAAAARECSVDLTFLRQTEARMRLLQGRAISSIPTDETGRRRFARAAGFATIADLDDRLHHTRERTRAWFARLVGG